jgi:hypothetical protein
MHPTFFATQTAMTALRARTGMNYAAAVKAGKFQLQLVKFDQRGRSTVTPVSDWLTADALVAACEQAQ